jgi:hypothetical protein
VPSAASTSVKVVCAVVPTSVPPKLPPCPENVYLPGDFVMENRPSAADGVKLSSRRTDMCGMAVPDAAADGSGEGLLRR